MSFTEQPVFRIGLLGILLISACLIYLTHHTASAFYRTSPTSLATIPSNSVGQTVSTSPSQLVIASSTEGNAPVMSFEIVTTTAAQQRGLGGRAVIPDNYAMLFVFPQDANTGFWMKDMLTSIDMIWVSDNGTIVGIDPLVSPATYPVSFYPPQPVKYVLETRAGFADEHGWTIGTHVSLPAPYGN